MAVTLDRIDVIITIGIPSENPLNSRSLAEDGHNACVILVRGINKGEMGLMEEKL